MAKKAKASVSEKEVSQVETGSVTEETKFTETDVTQSTTSETEKNEEVEAKSESEKVNEEINEVSEDAEAEANSVDDEVVASESSDTDEDSDDSQEVKKPNEKYFSFDKKEAKKFYVDKDGFLGVIFYKRLVIGIRGENTNNFDSLNDFASIVFNNVEALIKSLRFDDIDYQAFNIDESMGRDGRDVGIMSIDVPFTDKTPLFINRVRKLINTFPECYVRSNSNCRTCIDTTKVTNPMLLKGFVTFASYTRKSDDALKVTARSAAFIPQYLQIEDKDVSDLNRYILSSTKLNTIKDDEGIVHKLRDGTETIDKYMNYYQTIKSRICGMIFEVNDVNKDGKYLVNRIQFYIRILTKKIREAVIPTRIKIVTTKLDSVWMEDLQDIFTWKDPENKAGFLGNDDIIGTDPNVINLMDDISQIQDNVLNDVESIDIDEGEEKSSETV